MWEVGQFALGDVGRVAVEGIRERLELGSSESQSERGRVIVVTVGVPLTMTCMGG